MTPPVVLSITQRGRAGVYVGAIEGTGLRLRATRAPALDCARSLIAIGVDPARVLVMKAGDSIRMSGPIGQAARTAKNRAGRGRAGTERFDP